MKKIVIFLIITFIILSGCSKTEVTKTENNQTVNAEKTDTITTVDTSQMFTDRDMEVGYDDQTSAKIELSGASASSTSDAVEISESAITITDQGTYIVSGTLNDGIIIVKADDTDKVQLVLNNAEITSSTSAAIYILSADKVFITTASKTNNTLSNGGEYIAIDDNNIDAVIFSKSDLTLNGTGSLVIKAAAGHGIVSKDDLVFTSGTYDIDALSHGLSGKDSVRIANGNYTINSGKDGIHAENADDTSLGFLYISGGSFKITAQGDGMSAAAYMQLDDGEYVIESGGGAANGKIKSDTDSFGMGHFSSAINDYSSTQDDTSVKSIKASTNLIINSGTFNMDSADDALHSNGNLSIAGGSFEIVCADDAIHADSAVSISAGNINIAQSYEGIEGLSIDITGGEISLIASDDGLNAAGGNDSSGFGGRGGDMFAATEGAYINISGGILHINASGDGIDSNGNLTVTGGETYVSGPTNSANGALDYNGEATITGGIFVAAGASGMAQNFGSSSTQGVIMVTVNSGSAESTISLSDSSGAKLISWQSDKEYSSVIVSCPGIIKGATYTLTAGSYSTQITMDSIVYNSNSGMSGPMDNAAGGGKRPEGSMGKRPY